MNPVMAFESLSSIASGTALHEAAHAITAAAFGWPVRSAVVRTKLDGRVLWGKKLNGEYWQVDYADKYEWLIVTVAGWTINAATKEKGCWKPSDLISKSSVVRVQNIFDVGSDFAVACRVATLHHLFTNKIMGKIDFEKENDGIVKTIQAAEFDAMNILEDNMKPFIRLAKALDATSPRVVRGERLNTILSKVNHQRSEEN